MIQHEGYKITLGQEVVKPLALSGCRPEATKRRYRNSSLCPQTTGARYFRIVRVSTITASMPLNST